MLIDTLKDGDISSFVSLGLDEGWIISEEEIAKTKLGFPNLCYGAYIDGELVGGITGYLHEKSAWIGNFIIQPELRGRGIGRELFGRLLGALKAQRQTIYLHAALSAVSLYERFGFEIVGEACRYIYDTASEASESERTCLVGYEHQNYSGIMCAFDKRFFGEDRSEFLLEDMSSRGSLLLSSPNGFCHSKAVGENTVLGAWEMVEGAYIDAERMLRSVVGVRGQKNIYADTPRSNTDATAMLESCGFRMSGSTMIMVCGEALPVSYKNIYAFGSLGSKG